MASIFSGPKGTKAYLDNQVAKSTVDAAKYEAVGDLSKAAQATESAAKAKVASAQMTQQIIESNK